MKKFKVAIGYPPIESNKGVPLLSQNRQFQYFTSPTYVYPMVPAYAATMLKEAGYDVCWMDGISEGKKYSEWLEELVKENPDLLVLETKAPVIKKLWAKVNQIKKVLPGIVIVFVGDHVSWNPKESFSSCNVDYIITGGDYDFLLLNLVKSINEQAVLEGGIWGRESDDHIVLNKEMFKYEDSLSGEKGALWVSGPLKLTHELDKLPFVDRELTRWDLYAYENGNYRYTPATYMYSGRDCWWNRCTFCVWDHTINPIGSYRRFSPERLFAEVKYVVDKYHVKEIFDDAGTLFVGPPLKKFCELLIESGYNKKVAYGCNMRLNALTQDYYDLMGKANFKFILYGMESANQETLDKLDKGLKVEQIEEGVKMAKKGGLKPHITVMLGYPWETEEMALKTINLAKELFNKGYVDTMQATIVIPYPGTPLYNECKEKDLLQVAPNDYEAFDMRGPVMKIPFSNERLFELTQMLHTAFFTPSFILRVFKIMLSIRSYDEARYFLVSVKKVLGRVLDFDKNNKNIKYWSPAFWAALIKSFWSNLQAK